MWYWPEKHHRPPTPASLQPWTNVPKQAFSMGIVAASWGPKKAPAVRLSGEDKAVRYCGPSSGRPSTPSAAVASILRFHPMWLLVDDEGSPLRS